MQKLCVFFVLALIASEAMCMSFRQKRQAPQEQGTLVDSGSTTVSPSYQDCLRGCPVTPEYNPVCGTDRVTYNNPGRLMCAQACGSNVSLLRAAPCPPASDASS
ncbi:hypothetical protein O3G_MSEX004213 [Manduca sexta]|uniref:Kazal-like domain-containing protein n=1 Tax=Manduca sexta TaxID=7130 RepID=A0A922CHE8_MANSE|nr:hypothetical protein O3G_MSEX004213 [Manduca sexta]KAG6446029.1 hypothetical protein O3G_MSEX004213 [Manduca sexta]